MLMANSQKPTAKSQRPIANGQGSKNTNNEKDNYNFNGIDGFVFHSMQAYARRR